MTAGVETALQEQVNAIKSRIRRWVAEGADLRMARWQGALETLLITYNSRILPGDIAAATVPREAEAARFRLLHRTLDITPFVLVLFLPAAAAGRLRDVDPIRPAPSSAVAPDDASKVLVTSVTPGDRLLIAEISGHRPGIDILENGCLLGNYYYGDGEECIRDLSNIMALHFKPPAWNSGDYALYTENWFYRSAILRSNQVPVQSNNSYIHHPVLLGLNTIEAVFRLMRNVLLRLCAVTDTIIANANSANPYEDELSEITLNGLRDREPDQIASLNRYMETRLMGLLKLLKAYEIVNFKTFSEPDLRQVFRNLFIRTVGQGTDHVLKAVDESDNADAPPDHPPAV